MKEILSTKEIKEIYIDYFDLIDSFFWWIKHYLWEDKDSHINLWIDIANYPLISDLIIDAIGDLDDEIKAFWKENWQPLFDYIKNKNTLKCLYSWDITPVNLEDFIKKSCLYVDTVIISDPIYNLSVFQNKFILDKKYYLNKLLRHVFNIWRLKDLVLADTDENILMIIPVNLQLLKKENRNLIVENWNKQYLEYINLITNQSLINIENVNEFFDQFKSLDELFEVIDTSKPLASIFKDKDLFNDFIINMWDSSKFVDIWDLSFWNKFSMYIFSQFIRVGEHKHFCEKLIANPIYDYEVPWFFYNYCNWYEWMDNSIINTLQKDKFNWITNIPLNSIRVLREENKLDYMRSLLRTSLNDLNVKNDKNLVKTWEQIEENFIKAFKQQELEISALEREICSANKEVIITWGTTLLWFIPILGQAISLLSAWSNLKEIYENRSKDKVELTWKQENIINLLMKSHDE